MGDQRKGVGNVSKLCLLIWYLEPSQSSKHEIRLFAIQLPKKHHFDHTVLTQMCRSNTSLFLEMFVQVTHFEWQVELGEAKRSAEQIISTNTGVKMA